MKNDKRLAWFCRGDIDGFCGLFIDNLLQLMLIVTLCPTVAGLPIDLIVTRILPGAAVSILAGNLFYAWQARRLAQRTGRADVTALPYGINTPSLLAYIFLIMAPIYNATHDARLAWQAGLYACLGSALIECAGAFAGDFLRRHTPRAALLSALSGIAITFISMGFFFQVFASPSIALLPAFLILIVYGGRLRLPLGLPSGLMAVLLGTGLAWLFKLMGGPSFSAPVASVPIGLHLPQPVIGELLEWMSVGQGLTFLAIIFPMGLFNVIGSLQNLESAAASGDNFKTRASLLANGIGSLAAATFGSPFPTTIYIGHPGWKAMGARWGYSILNGMAITLLCLLGGVTWVMSYVPVEAALGILIWIGIIITAQAFQEVPKAHALAVAFGLLPALAAWARVLIETALRACGSSLSQSADKFGSDFALRG
ncbi:MAG: NCS2 family permease, partial [Vicinamibacteria bacterium]|nr:NCS2 family permease [Vicinamibacteria bacterium]